ncbi:MAG: ADP-ribose pyrophosphatase [Chloroflexi bacterium]|nr:ADP-ribose pyrophosphatase [Chloroflexota bacterium]|tara:strand:+ start:5798 stop:6364 length:567 start_codon:yes stop_codon:yes gene_type:complete
MIALQNENKNLLPKIISSEIVLRGNPFDIERSHLQYPDDIEADRMVVLHPGAIALMVIDDEDKILLVNQYRYPTKEILLEIPAGTREPNEQSLDTAAREVREETGYSAESLVHIGGTWMAPGFCTEYIDYFVASNLSYDPLPQDPDEFISEPIRVTYEEMVSLISSSKIKDAKSIVGFMLYQIYKSRE